jgi:hypothetical protein
MLQFTWFFLWLIGLWKEGFFWNPALPKIQDGHQADILDFVFWTDWGKIDFTFLLASIQLL